MTEISIRTYTRDDIDAIIELDGEWKREGIAHVWVEYSREEQLADIERFSAYCLIAECDGVTAGYVNGTIRQGKPDSIVPLGEPYLEVENIYVRQEYRHQNIGGQLLEALLEAAQQDGIGRFMVGTTSREMDKILRFYGNHGFGMWYVQLVRQG